MYYTNVAIGDIHVLTILSSIPIFGCPIDTARFLTSFKLSLAYVNKKESLANGPGVAVLEGGRLTHTHVLIHHMNKLDHTCAHISYTYTCTCTCVHMH